MKKFIKTRTHHDQVVCIPEMQNWLTSGKQINIIILLTD